MLLVGAPAVLPQVAVANESAVEFSLHVEIATVDGEPVVSEEWIEAHRQAANSIFGPAHVQFTSMDVNTNGEMAPDLITRADRHRLGPLVDSGRGDIHVFVVRSMADVDVEDRLLRGVHWRSNRGGGFRHFVVLTTLARPNVLAHELGHFFGNPHSDTPGNIMSYQRGEGPPFFDAAQLRRIRRFRERFLRSGELVPR
ncbi:MAG: hypothetical protein AB8H86_24490 [Polyangiales bacterium]